MSDDLRRLIADATKLGFTFKGQQIRGGHLRFEHVSGALITTSSTPSDIHAWTNARTDMERVAGIKLPRDNKAGKRHFVKVERSDLQPSAAEIQRGEIVDRLVARADMVRVEFRCLALAPCRSNAAKARDLLDEFNDIKDELAAFHRVIKPIY